MPNEFLKLKVKVKKVAYAIEPEDLCDCETHKEFIEERKRILKSLPQKLTFVMEWPKDEMDDEDGIADEICDMVSDITGWLNYGVSYTFTY